jgi:signal transduction histidine kinase
LPRETLPARPSSKRTSPSSTCDEILLASRLDAVEHLDHAEEIDLLALAAEECARYDGCSIGGKPILVRGDPVLLRRMIRNLVENAERHGRQPIEVGLGARDGRALLHVRDQGPLIGERERAGLFLPFHRVAGASGSEGTGLGLALVRQIARRHDGDVAYEPERGSCFTVSLPVLGDAAAAQSGFAAAIRENSLPASANSRH